MKYVGVSSPAWSIQIKHNQHPQQPNDYNNYPLYTQVDKNIRGIKIKNNYHNKPTKQKKVIQPPKQTQKPQETFHLKKKFTKKILHDNREFTQTLDLFNTHNTGYSFGYRENNSNFLNTTNDLMYNP